MPDHRTIADRFLDFYYGALGGPPAGLDVLYDDTSRYRTGGREASGRTAIMSLIDHRLGGTHKILTAMAHEAGGRSEAGSVIVAATGISFSGTDGAAIPFIETFRITPTEPEDEAPPFLIAVQNFQPSLN
ncbi:hypothetical protein HUT18_00430 [Streptomyces sp. NA04227]|uniref:ketosteroid isomerase family protein n=1 Tax=Streptomyces sp. NA04227 TaxID=2742136 RepID=UPI001592084D|nr:ketosteroid isomerase family protein [Streptomyces sp. NA04227]QKW05046.1 hypothetical protein HUT18_00430 [Streptomyces sp. NA04227]